MGNKKIRSALISVYDKKGLEPVLEVLHREGVKLISTGGTAKYINDLGYPVQKVEDISGYPSILGGRVKTLHPSVFGGILAKREAGHLDTLKEYDIPPIDCVVVDLYPFEETVKEGASEDEIIEKIDIGGVSLIRAAAKNFRDVVVVPSKAHYTHFLNIVKHSDCATTLDQRSAFAGKAFALTSHYDSAIQKYVRGEEQTDQLTLAHLEATSLRYGENPHQRASFYGDPRECIRQIHGKPLSYNNLLDIDAAVFTMAEFADEPPTVAVFKHNNSCGLATRSNLPEAWKMALAGDPLSAFGGVICSNVEMDEKTALEIDKIFYEVLIAPSFSKAALEVLQKRKKRILVQLNKYPEAQKTIRSTINGFLVQDRDNYQHEAENWIQSTEAKANEREFRDLQFANKVVKHLKSNAIALINNQMIIGIGAGQTSRVDALKGAIEKAGENNLPLKGAVMASDAFFPFKDCVEIAHQAGIKAVVQPGGSVKDKDSIDFCDENGMSMYLTGIRHFKH